MGNQDPTCLGATMPTQLLSLCAAVKTQHRRKTSRTQKEQSHTARSRGEDISLLSQNGREEEAESRCEIHTLHKPLVGCIMGTLQVGKWGDCVPFTAPWYPGLPGSSQVSPSGPTVSPRAGVALPSRPSLLAQLSSALGLWGPASLHGYLILFHLIFCTCIS